MDGGCFAILYISTPDHHRRAVALSWRLLSTRLLCIPGSKRGRRLHGLFDGSEHAAWAGGVGGISLSLYIAHLPDTTGKKQGHTLTGELVPPPGRHRSSCNAYER